MFSDYHVHSEFSFDSEEKIDNIISKAIELKMNQIVITDHEDFNWPVEGETPLIDLPKYNLVLSQKKEQYKNKIKLFKGIELGDRKSRYSMPGAYKCISVGFYNWLLSYCGQHGPILYRFLEKQTGQGCF
mgnify:CR=1 FL=1